jgi:hypothetical protein
VVQFNDWCDSADTPLGNHHVRVMTARSADSATGIRVTAAAVPTHYAAEERMVPSRHVLELADASSGDMRLSDHAARSMI